MYKDFIPANTAPVGVRRIGVYNVDGVRVGQIDLGNLLKNKGQKLYSFGALSDVHVQYDTAHADFQKALKYLNDTEDVAFTCICGDLTVNGTDAELTQYKGYVDSYSPDTPVYAVFGNHDTYQGLHNNTQKYTGHPLNYTFTHGDDVFIMVGNISGYSGAVGTLFTQATFQWLYEQLEANRNKRCFLFQHILSKKGSGDAFNAYPYTKLSGAEATVFESLISHYKNVVWFHGHSHMKFYLQYGNDMANVDKYFGVWSVHIPSLSVPRDASMSGSGYTTIYADSEGYVVDVYENGIHLRGRDFVKGEFLPIASYWLDTPLQTVAEGTYTDSTGTIVTPGGTGGYTNQVPIAIDQNGNTVVDGAMYTDSRWDYSGGVTPQEGYFITGLIPARPGDFVRVRWNNTERYGDAGYQCLRVFGADKTPIDIRLPFLYMFDPSTDAGAAFTSVEGFRYDRAAGILDFQVLAYSSIPAATEYLTFTLSGEPYETIITVNEVLT